MTRWFSLCARAHAVSSDTTSRDLALAKGQVPIEPQLRWTPFSVQLREELDDLQTLGAELLSASGIEYRGDFNRGGNVVFVAPDWAWTDPTDELRRLQMKLVPRFDEWRKRYALLFRTAPTELREQVNETIDEIRVWLARDGSGWSGWDVPDNITKAIQIQTERFTKLRQLLDVVAPQSELLGQVIGLPDTSALIDAPDLANYRQVLGTSADIYLAPSVLAELDSLNLDDDLGGGVAFKRRPGMGCRRSD